MKKKKSFLPWIIFLGLAIIILLVIGKKRGWFGKDVTLKVSTEKVEIRDITEIITANGKLKPLKEVKISPEVPGEIIELPVKEGERVKKGDLLVVIKPDIYQSSLSRIEASLNTQKARLAQAEAQLIERELNYQRAKQLLEKKTIPKSEFETIEAAWKVAISEVQAARYSVKSAESSVKEANENLTKTKIFSPIDGTVSKLNVEKGEKVVGTNQFAGTELMTVADLNTMEVKVEVNENDIVKVQKSDTANIEIDAYLKRKFKGIVTEIASSANVTGTTVDQVTNFNVKIVLLAKSYQDLIEKDTLKYPFLPGMSATVEILTDTRKGIISVPIQAVTTRGDDGTIKNAGEQMEKVGTNDTNSKEITPKEPEQHEVVFVIKNNLAWKKRVKTGIQDNTRIEILDGLAVGDEVIVAPYGLISKTLKDSTAIQIVKIEDLYQIKK
ncbi:MAG: efflux RND transporter periplasmic adaptor subunit [Prolixibacteraceae bacterium]|jgi:HlyD family secretion protein|nr:efflux RND transporter periplasmic adaptor subunit [Prolixibacteraceae bacterium]